MKKKHLSLMIALPALILMLSISACRKSSPPIDCIGAIPDSAFVAQPVSFISCTKGANTYLWNFGDGSTATTDSAVHTYTTAGVYHGSLTTSNGQSSTKTFTIIVTNNAAGYFTLNGKTYFPAACDSMYFSILYAYFPTDSPGGGTLSFGFNPSFPASSGPYIVSSSAYVGPVQPGQVDVDLKFGGSAPLYHSSGGNGMQQVAVTVLGNRRLNLVGTNIEMVNLTAPYDSFAISFNITQTQ